MLNPTYLSCSRHHIYYFRYLLPPIIRKQGNTRHIKVSLGTRDPKQALRLAGVLEYHATHDLNWELIARMNNVDVIKLVKEYFRCKLESRQKEIRDTGLLSPLKRKHLISLIEQSEYSVIGQGIEEEDVFWNSDKKTWTEEMIEVIGVKVDKDSEEFEWFKQERKHGVLWFAKQLLDYNDTYRAKAYEEQSVNQSIIDVMPEATRARQYKPENELQAVIDGYVKEMSSSGVWRDRAKEEQASCLNTLVEIFGNSIDVNTIDIPKARHVKSVLVALPKNRNRNTKTKKLNILEQIKVVGQEKIAAATVNKYLMYFGALFKWAKNNGYAQVNPFEGLALKQSKDKALREAFTSEQVGMIFAELAKRGKGFAPFDYQYWGVLIAFYTGARLNEVASLRLDDVKQGDTGIWYFDINDEEETKRLKTKAAIRVVPVHSQLIALGFLNYLQQVKDINPANNRLLHELTFNKRTQWGRNLSRWFNDQFLVKLSIKKPQYVFHSLRHNAISGLVKGNVEVVKIQALVGHEPNTVTIGTYGHGYELSQLKEAIECLKYK